MSKVDILVPEDLSLSEDEAVIASWLHDSGEEVTEGDLICEIMVGKTAIELLAPATGTLSISAHIETVVKPNSVIGYIEM